MKNTICRRILLLIVVFFYCGLTSVFAEDKLVKIKSVTVTDSSEGVEVGSVTVQNNSLSSSVKFNDIGNYVTFEFEFENTSNRDYYLASISNYFDDYLSIRSSSIGALIPKNGKGTIKMKLVYDKELYNQDQLTFDGSVSFDFVDTPVLTNPKTSGREVLKFLIVIALLFGCFFALKREKRKVLILILLLLPCSTFADEKLSVSFQFSNITVKGSYLDYEIRFLDDDADTVLFDPYTVTYGDTVGNLPVPQKEGYEFLGWQDADGNEVDNRTIVHNNMTLHAMYEALFYHITYVLNGGTLSQSNPTTYTPDDEFTLNNSQKNSYVFVGWSVDTETAIVPSVTIYKGTTGDLTFVANYVADSEDITYSVVHRQMNINGTYEETERDVFPGEAGTTVSPQPKVYTGFTSPSGQSKIVSADGSTSFVYDYSRIKYSLSYGNSSRVASSSTTAGQYYYNTSITASAVSNYSYDEMSNYGYVADSYTCTFQKWVNDDTGATLSTSTTYTFNIVKNMNLTPVYQCSVVYSHCLSGEVEVEVWDKKKKKKKKKKLRDVTLDDLILVWDFDKGEFTYVKASFILKPTIANEHYLLHFSDGSVLDVVGDHRMFNLDKNMFTHCMSNEETPIGTKTINRDGKIITLLSKETVYSPVDVCRVITEKHFNLYTNGILTSIAVNNMYPIQDMKFVKEDRNEIHRDELNVDDYVFEALRYGEIPSDLRGNLESTKSFLEYCSKQLSSDDYLRNEHDERDR